MSADFLNVETINEMNSRLNAEIHKLDEQFKTQVNNINYFYIYIYFFYGYLVNILFYIRL